ncbi:MAG TPA: DNA-binding protein YbiB [Burkholderiaceae bacterium]|nr:DNA-binding protein YbiB [Burkholderiaceae bacterium]
MSIAKYIKVIGRGKDGAKPVNREEATDLMLQILDGKVSDLEVGGFCIAMRIKGETELENAGFLDALDQRMNKIKSACPVVVIPTYNGARKLPALTPLLALLLAREGKKHGFAVLMHGAMSDDTRVSSFEILQAFGNTTTTKSLVFLNDNQSTLSTGQMAYVDTHVLSQGLGKLLNVRRTIGLRNPAHSIVKLMNPVDDSQPACVITSYTHPEYLHSMTATFKYMGTQAMLMRGTEGEPVADARRTPEMNVFKNGVTTCVQEAQAGSLVKLPDLPADISAENTARYMEAVLHGAKPVPEPIATQVKHIVELMRTN